MQVNLNGYKKLVNFPFTANETSTQIVNSIQFLKRGNNEVTITSIDKGTLWLDYLEVAAE